MQKFWYRITPVSWYYTIAMWYPFWLCSQALLDKSTYNIERERRGREESVQRPLVHEHSARDFLHRYSTCTNRHWTQCCSLFAMHGHINFVLLINSMCSCFENAYTVQTTGDKQRVCVYYCGLFIHWSFFHATMTQHVMILVSTIIFLNMQTQLSVCVVLFLTVCWCNNFLAFVNFPHQVFNVHIACSRRRSY